MNLSRLKKATTELVAAIKELESAQSQPVQPTLIETPEAKKPDRCPYVQIVANYNLICISLPKCSQLSPARREAIRNRWHEAGCPIDAFTSFFQRVEASNFLTGRMTTSAFRASFDWLMRPANFIKVAEGNYDNRANSKQTLLTAADHDDSGTY